MKDKLKLPLNYFMLSFNFLIHEIVILLIIVFMIGLSLSGCSKISQSNKYISESAFILNTVISITLYDTDNNELIEQCFDLCRNYELIFSRTDQNSELYQLNKNHEGSVSDDLLHVINTALEYCKISDGKFDITMGGLSDKYGFSTKNPTVPTHNEIIEELSHIDYHKIYVHGNYIKINDSDTIIDLGSIAKGYIADKLKDFLISNGVKSGIINLGGNVLCIGSKPDGNSFGIGIQYPFGEASETIAKVNISDMSVVTSGIYERCFYKDDVLYHHILNPKTGLPVNNGLLSVTIIGRNSEICDALSTSAFVCGTDFIEKINKIEGYYAVYVTDDYEMIYSKGFENLLSDTSANK